MLNPVNMSVAFLSLAMLSACVSSQKEDTRFTTRDEHGLTGFEPPVICHLRMSLPACLKKATEFAEAFRKTVVVERDIGGDIVERHAVEPDGSSRPLPPDKKFEAN